MNKVYVGTTDVGRGIFAAQDFHVGDEILVFKGPLVDADHPMHHTEAGANLLQIDEQLYILPDPPGVFANHSCCPNAGVVHTTTLIALREIRKDEEIRFDYSTTMDEDLWTMQCLCGEPECRGVVEDFKYLPQEVQRAYLTRGIVQPFIVRKMQILSDSA